MKKLITDKIILPEKGTEQYNLIIQNFGTIQAYEKSVQNMLNYIKKKK